MVLTLLQVTLSLSFPLIHIHVPQSNHIHPQYIAMSSKSLIENNLTSSSSPTGCNHQKKKKMFPSNHGKNMSNPHAYFAEQCLLGDQITFSRSEPTSSFFHFSPFHDHNNRFLNYGHELRSGQQPKSPNPSTAADVGTTSNAVASKKALTEDMAVLGTTQKIFSGKNTSMGGASTSRRRSSNRERHSKIFTAQGLRDRRMRLSVDVAHKFFGLQDMLGFDKASKTISWLLTKSKAAIKDLGRGLSQTEGYGSDNAKGANSTSESEDISGLDETTVTVDQQEKGLKKKSLEAAPKSKRIRGSQKDTICAAAKESRAIARAKARERTREKMSERLEKSKQLPKGSPNAQYQLTPLRPLGSAESASLINHDKKPFELGAEINEPNKLGLSIDEYHQHLMNNGLMTFFPENWDMDTTRTRPSGCDMPNTHLFTGF